MAKAIATDIERNKKHDGHGENRTRISCNQKHSPMGRGDEWEEPTICIDGESQRVESPVEPTIFIDGERRWCTVLKRPTIRRHAREMMFDGMKGDWMVYVDAGGTQYCEKCVRRCGSVMA